MLRDYKQQLDDILQAITFIREYVKDMDYKAFEADRKTQDAVIRNLEIIGEAARIVPLPLKVGGALFPNSERREVLCNL